MNEIDRVATGESFTSSHEEVAASVAEYHGHYGCIVCGNRTASCTPTSCVQERIQERLDARSAAS